MKFVRLVIGAVVVLGTIVAWEYCRDYIYENFQDTENVITEESENSKEDDESEVKKADESEKNGNSPSSENEQQKISKKDEDLAISFEKGFENVAKKAMHSVVNVATMQLVEGSNRMDLPDIFKGGPFDDLFKDFFNFPQKKQKVRKANALGSGFIIQVDKDVAYIVTNNHVVDKAKKIVICLSDKTELPAQIHAVDPRTDIAVLSVSLKDVDIDHSKLVPMEWGDSAKLNEGNFVIAIGNPFGLGSTVTHGIVSATGRNIAMGKTSLSLIDNYIQHSAPINMGNSGGALLDVHGKVIGINNAIFSTSGGNIGIGFAIPSNLAKITVDQLIKHKRTYRGWLGAEVHAVGEKQAESVGLIKKSSLESSKIYGAYVARVVPNGPAEKAGIRVGDIIIEFNGKKISENYSLQMAVGSAEIESSVKVKVWRQKNTDSWHSVELNVKVGDFEGAMKSGNIDAKNQSKDENKFDDSEATIEPLGITVSPLPEQYKNEYSSDVKVIVSKVDEEKSTSFYGPVFIPGDGFISANNKKVSSVKEFQEIINEVVKNPKNKNRPIPFVIVRDGFQMMIATTLDFPEKEQNPKKK